MYVYKGNAINKWYVLNGKLHDIPYLNGKYNPASIWWRLNLKLFQSFFLRTNSPSFIQYPSSIIQYEITFTIGD